MKLNEAIKGYVLESKIRRQAKGSMYNKQLHLGRFESWCREQGYTTLEEITVTILREYVSCIQEMQLPSFRENDEGLYQTSTIINYLKTLKAFFRWCEQEGLLGEHANPANRLPKLKADEYVIPTFSPEQLQTMLDLCEVTTATGYRNYTMLLVLMDTGIRVSELVSLKLDDVHEDYLTVFGKGSKQRQVGIGPTTVKALWKYINHFRASQAGANQLVFVSRNGHRLFASNLWVLMQNIGERAGIRGVRNSPHTFRHTFAFNWLANGGDVYKLSRVLGHSDIQTTQIYLKAFQSKEARADHVSLSPVEVFRLRYKNGRR